MSAVLDKQMTLPADDNETRWQAILSRDPRCDGTFVFSVSSTGIYCRPSCPARRPRRDRVSFFESPADAEKAGFRSCRRCRPTEAGLIDSNIELVKSICKFIDDNDEQKLSLEVLSKRFGLSSFHLQRTFKKLMGVTPRQYAEATRSKRFRDGLQSGESITAALYDAGYGSSSRLYEHSDAELGMTPGAYSRRGREMKINYTVVSCALGYLLVAATSKGVCSVRLGDSASQLETDLRQEFEAAEILRTDGPLFGAVKQILDHLSAKEPRLELPLDIRATAFQRQVWEALRSIPYGETRSYGDVARQIGQPTAVRAVARACATNPVALLIPCHRVIREDKSLGGYRWGIERKRRLLQEEKSKNGKG
jgi:AraC family transcriptional regulator of adaptative response/methylated-DNA-[protein]-cysteine methyltransferase